MVGVDVGEGAVKVVRLKRTGSAISLVAADLLSVVDLASTEAPGALAIGKPLQGLHAAIAVSTPQVSLRLLTVPGDREKVQQLNFNELLGVPEGSDYRIGYEIIASDGRSEQTILAAGIPERQAVWAGTRLLPHGMPAPCSLQAGGLAALNCVAQELRVHHGDATALAVQVGADVSFVAAFHRGKLSLLRQCATGSQALVRSVSERFGIEAELVPGALEEGMIDASQTIGPAIEPFLRQLVLAREFVERKRSCRVEKILLGGAQIGANQWSVHIEQAMGIAPQTWDPLAVLPVQTGALAPDVRGAQGRFAAAVGAALAVMEKSSDVSH